MIDETRLKRYCCEDLSKIENYEQAKMDMTQTWEIHHRIETDLPCCELMPTKEFSHDDLVKHGLYLNRPASELKFVTRAEHNRIHRKTRGYSVKQRLNTPERLKEREQRKIERERIHQEQLALSRQRMKSIYKRLGVERSKGRWWTDGTHNRFGKECPEGFHAGFTKRAKTTEETRRKMREHHPRLKPFLGHHHTPESNEKNRLSKLGRKRYTNGVKNIVAHDCPEGYVSGWTKKHSDD